MADCPEELTPPNPVHTSTSIRPGTRHTWGCWSPRRWTTPVAAIRRGRTPRDSEGQPRPRTRQVANIPSRCRGTTELVSPTSRRDTSGPRALARSSSVHPRPRMVRMPHQIRGFRQSEESARPIACVFAKRSSNARSIKRPSVRKRRRISPQRLVQYRSSRVRRRTTHGIAGSVNGFRSPAIPAWGITKRSRPILRTSPERPRSER